MLLSSRSSLFRLSGFRASAGLLSRTAEQTQSAVRLVQHAQKSFFSSSSFSSSPSSSGLENAINKKDIEHAIHQVRAHDPAGYLPGRLLPTKDMSAAYYITRSFWVETGLRFGTTAHVAPNASPAEHIEWWQQGVDEVYEGDEGNGAENFDHPTLRLLKALVETHPNVSKSYLDDILTGRRKDIDLKQYTTMQSLIEHAQLSCGSLSKIVLEVGGVKNPKAFEAAQYLGVAHGLTNALRLSIPVMSTTGKLIVPEELTKKYGVKSPRYLLSSLGLGDEQCKAAFHNAIRDIAMEAKDNLQKARDLRPELLAEDDGKNAVAVFLPGLASETFLDRLEQVKYDLTDRNLRNVGLIERWTCGARMMLGYAQQTY